MRTASNTFSTRSYRLVLAAGLLGAAVSACSQDSTRLSDDPFSNPFASRKEVASQGDPAPQRPAAIESQPLAGPVSQPTNYASAPRSVPSAPAQYAQNPSRSPEHTASPRGESGWRADGSSAVTLQSGESVHTIAQRYGVPASEIMRANSIADASRVAPGTRLLIPTYQAAGVAPSSQLARNTPAYTPAPATAAMVRTPIPEPTRSNQTHVVAGGETLYSLGRRYNTSPMAIAQANGLSNDASLRVGQRVSIPGGSAPTAMASASRPATQFSAPPAQRTDAPAPVRTASLQTTEAPQKVAAVTPAAEPEEETRSLGGSPQFRMPVRGRIISGYGPKANGQHNDGINVAVPEGTEVKAAEDGVVAYAGNELKGYGNLVLLRHSDGWMTAYAHNSQLLVKRGDTIKRGQNVARAGQTGGVTSPQVHFEIRKGSTPVDPTKYLAGL
jgi:murein DD-endopeptidase MepM/ murein hydrolase activator NlpD